MEEIENLLREIKKIKKWKVNLVHITSSSKNGIEYNVDEILGLDEKISTIISEKVDNYIDKDINELYSGVENYEGIIENNKIYKLDLNKGIITEEYNRLINSLGNPNLENISLERKYDFYIFKNDITSIKIISVKNPIKTIRKTYLLESGMYKDISGKVLSFDEKIDIILTDKTVYFFNSSGEKVFNMERTFKKISNSLTDDIVKANFINDSNSFKLYACSGHNPRRFMAFKRGRLSKMKDDIQLRKDIAKKCNLKMNGDEIDTTDPDNVTLLVKVLCEKVQEDLFTHNPVEVDSSKALLKG